MRIRPTPGHGVNYAIAHQRQHTNDRSRKQHSFHHFFHLSCRLSSDVVRAGYLQPVKEP